MRNKNNLHKLILHDLRSGILQNYKSFIPVVVLFLSACFIVYRVAITETFEEPGETARFFDYLWYAFHGMGEYDPLSGERFTLPVFWLTIQLYIAYLVSHYPLKDLLSYGQQMLLRSKSRRDWWFSKCVCNFQ